jgi:hypothetical protein
MRNGYVVLVAAIMLAGCAASKEVRVPEQLAKRPQAYRDAYIDGCKSAQSKESQKDMERMQKDSLYANGWYEGYEECTANNRPAPTRENDKKEGAPRSKKFG